MRNDIVSFGIWQRSISTPWLAGGSGIECAIVYTVSFRRSTRSHGGARFELTSISFPNPGIQMNRRNFIRSTAAALTAGVGASLWGTKFARAFGEIPKNAESILIPAERRASNILEIFLYGGVSQYESFYCIPSFGQVSGTQWHTFLNDGQLQAAVDKCGWVGPLTEPFALDGNGSMVHLGPFVMPLRERPDVVSRMRISITAHDLEPHEGAIPLMLAGRGLGHPALSGLGAHIQRYCLDRYAETDRAPYAYALVAAGSNGLPTDNVRAVTAIGLHPGAARPLMIQVDGAGELMQMLDRKNVAAVRPQYDALMQHYIDRQRTRLRWKNQGSSLRTPRLGELEAAARAMANAPAISGVFGPEFFQTLGGSNCGDNATTDAMTMNLKLAAHLLTHPTTPAKYVCVVDTGLIGSDGGGGYDTHVENSITQSRNLSHTLKQLLAVVNQPGENDPTKIDLDDTLIVLTTEFGRTPYKQGDKGRNHWPYGFPVVFIGGPVRPDNAGIFGSCNEDGYATLASSPQENRIAALLALGIWPFASESYNVSDVPDAANEVQAVQFVQKRQLGVAT